MAEEDTASLLSNFEQIYQDFKKGIAEIQLLRSKWNAEIKKREAVEAILKLTTQENECLIKLYTDSLNNLAEQLDCRTKCQSLKDELGRARDEHLCSEDEHRKAIENLKTIYAAEVSKLEAQVRGFLVEKAASEVTMNHLHQDLAAHKSHVQNLSNSMNRTKFELESRYHNEIQDLRDCLLAEQEEKKELNRKLQDLEKELVISKGKLVEQQQDLASLQRVETLKLKIMKLRKDNEVLRRKLSLSEKGYKVVAETNMAPL